MISVASLVVDLEDLLGGAAVCRGGFGVPNDSVLRRERKKERKKIMVAIQSTPLIEYSVSRERKKKNKGDSSYVSQAPEKGSILTDN